LNPGDEAKLDVEWDVPSGPGTHAFAVLLDAGKKRLPFRGFVEVADCVRIDPDRIRLEVPPGQTRGAEVTVRASLNRQLPEGVSLTVRDETANEIKCHLKEKGSIVAVWEVAVTGVSGLGDKEYALLLKTRDPLQPEVEIPVSVLHQEEFEVRPRGVTFAVGRSAMGTQWVTVHSNTDKSPTIETTLVDDAAVVSAEVRRTSTGIAIGITPRNQRQSEDVGGEVCVVVQGHRTPLKIPYLILAR
jgi:hypothetical protein